jgi:AraC family transcriptional regulator of adaptative response / DNA-3-methyladenine glycosylase II
MVRLGFEAPYDAEQLLGFLGARAWPGVEEVSVDSRTYRRVSSNRGVELRIGPESVEVTKVWAEAPARSLLDLEASPAAIALVLDRDPLIRPLVRRRPGLRVPGAFDAFEVALRAVIGQQISVAGATTLAGRLRRAAGSLEPAVVAEADLTRVGLTSARSKAVRALARAAADGRVRLEPGAPPEALLELPGVGPWTAAYIAMRALREPDAIPLSDLGLRRALKQLGADTSPAAVSRLAENWRPYRAYAAMHLWASL